jgi:hypothetical protein
VVEEQDKKSIVAFFELLDEWDSKESVFWFVRRQFARPPKSRGKLSSSRRGLGALGGVGMEASDEYFPFT